MSGLVDRQDQFSGLAPAQPGSVTQRENDVIFDTRDCVGELSLRQARLAFSYANASKIPVEDFRRATVDGIIDPDKLLGVVCELGMVGWPSRNPTTPLVSGNTIRYRLPLPVRNVKALDIINVIMPRDIVPMYIYFPGFVNSCLPYSLQGDGKQYLTPDGSGPNSVWESPVPETLEDFVDEGITGINRNKLGGVYYTPLRYWRAYTGPNCMANPHTPPPYQLWNPPQDHTSSDPWPFQFTPVKNQRIPTYRAKNGVVFAGYGVYDLEDFPESQELQLADGVMIRLPLRKLILKRLVPSGQFVHGVAAEDLIDRSSSDDFNADGIVDNPMTQTGYGDYQRFIPGPGIGQAYQPNQPRANKAAPIDLGISTFDPETGSLGPMPVPFPAFRGNVWGPYARPGDRFQNLGLQTTVDELYLNGDLDNLEGNPVVWPSYDASVEPYTFEMYTASLRRISNIVRFQSVESSSNINIKNAMRVRINGGFGAAWGYVGDNCVERGKPGPLVCGGLPNTRYDGQVRQFNHEAWTKVSKAVPDTWLDTLPGPLRPDIVKGGWIYMWRDIFPWSGSVYVPVTAGGVGPMALHDADGDLQASKLQWSADPVLGESTHYEVPDSVPSNSEYVSGLAYGKIVALEMTGGGVGYQDSFDNFPGDVPNYQLTIFYVETGSRDSTNYLTAEVDEVESGGRIASFSLVSGQTVPTNTFMSMDLPYDDNPIAYNPETPAAGKYAMYWVDQFGTFETIIGGLGYTPGRRRTIAVTGSGSGLEVEIEVDYPLSGPIDEEGEEWYRSGAVARFTVLEQGSGYEVGDIVRVLEQGSHNNALFLVTEVSVPPEKATKSVFSYVDPQAGGGNNFGSTSGLSLDYVATGFSQGVDTVPPGAKYEFITRSRTAQAANSSDNPTDVPANVLTNDFTDQPEGGIERENMAATYLGARSSFVDGQFGGFIAALTNYRTFFVSSTPDTDVVIRVSQAERGRTQSHNAVINHSNFTIPVRLSLGTASGTLEYVEAVQGTLTSSGVYWKNTYNPPIAEMSVLDVSLWTQNGTPIPIERCLGFAEQFRGQAMLTETQIAGDREPEPSGVIMTGTTNSKSLSNPFDPLTSLYTQRNLGITFRISSYEALNHGTHDLDPDQSYGESFEDLIPLAGNIDEYAE